MKKLAAASIGWLMDNPVITKELRGRMRGPRAYWVMLAYLLMLATAMTIAYYAWRQSEDSTASFTIARTFFEVLFYVQASLVTLITPALTSGAISIEREQRTFEMMRCTTLRPASIILGKLTSSISFVTLLLVCSLPMVSICFLLGGVSPEEVLAAYAMLICDALLFGAIGIVWSTCAANTAAATALAYVSLFVYFVLTFTTAVDAQLPYANSVLSALNPIGAVSAASHMERYFGFSVAAWIPAVLVSVLLTVLLCAVAVNRMEDYPWFRAAPVRLFTFLWAGVVLYFIDGSIVAGSGSSDRPAMIGLTGLIALMLVLPSLATGDPISEAEHGLTTGPPVLSPIVALREASMRTSPMISLMFGVVVAAVSIGTVSGVVPHSAAVDLSICALFVGLIAGACGVGALLSKALRNRWGAMVVIYVLLAFGSIVPLIVHSATENGLVAHANAQNNWLYFSPVASIIALDDKGSGHFFSGAVFDGHAQPWPVTSLLYLAIGVICYLASRAMRTKTVAG